MPAFVSQLAGRRVLVVEDNWFIASELKHWLQAAGAEVVGPVPTVAQALALIEADGLRAAVLDVNLLDDETSFPVADRLQALGVPFLFATGNPETAAQSAHHDRPRLQKPFLASELTATLKALMN